MSSTTLISDIFLIISNIFILISVRWAYKKKFYTETYILFQSGLVSAIYHSYSLFSTSQILFNSLKFMDFYCAVLVLVALSVYAMDLDNKSLKPTPILFFSSIIIFALNLIPFDYYFEIAISSLCLIMVIISYIVRKRLPRCKKLDCFLSLCFISAGLFCFHYGNDVGPYWIMHSLWHVLIMSSTYFILKVPVNSYLPKVSDVITNCRNITKYFNIQENDIEMSNKPTKQNTSVKKSLSLNDLDKIDDTDIKINVI